ncbi:MAG: hypothetical protein KC441_00810 [Anaerolineales bacterium]|nr:hypothetical protein [Anaerolineales bacterium]
MTQIHTYWQIVKRGWWIILLTAVVAVVASLIYSSLSPRVYQTTTRYIVSPQEVILSNQTDYFRSLDTLDRRSIVTTYAEVFGSSRVFQEAAASLADTTDTLDNYVATAVSLPDANVIQLSVEGPDPNVVMQLADAIGTRSKEYIEGLYFMYAITLLDSPSVPQAPISPTPVRDAFVAGILGLAVGAVLAILYVSYVDRRGVAPAPEDTVTQPDPAIN